MILFEILSNFLSKRKNMKNHALKFNDIQLKDYLIIDIREKIDFDTFHIQDAIHIQDITRISYIAKENQDKKILLYCYHGNTARYYTQHLINAGFTNIYFLKENYEEFETLGIPLEYA